MPKDELKKRKKPFLEIGAIMLSLLALIISIRSCTISENALDFQIEESNTEKETKLNVDIKTVIDKIYISEFETKPFRFYFIKNKLNTIDGYYGLNLIFKFKITNNSLHAITIDEISSKFEHKLAEDLFIPSLGSYKEDFTLIINPIKIEPYSMERINLLLPIPHSDSLLPNFYKSLETNKFYECDTIVKLFEKGVGACSKYKDCPNIFKNILLQLIGKEPLGDGNFGIIHYNIHLATGENFIGTYNPLNDVFLSDRY